MTINRQRLIINILVVFGLFVSTASGQEPTSKAALVVRLDDGSEVSRCVAFEEEQISGLELLERSGLDLDIKYEGMGSLVCSIEGQGCGSDDCFCQCKGGDDCVYWSYWQQEGQAWQYAQLGASAIQVGDSQVNGWSWGPGSPTEAIEPSMLTYDEICSGPVVSNGEPLTEDTSSGPDPIVIVGFGFLLILLAAAVLVSKRRGEEG